MQFKLSLLLSTADPGAPLPLCDNSSPNSYAYVLPVPREGTQANPATCSKQTGDPVPITHVHSPASWSTDFLVAVRHTASSADGIILCPG